MQSAIGSPVVATEPSDRVFICPACRVDCTAVTTGRPRRYPSDLRDEEWRRLARLLPPIPARGRRPTWCRRIILDAIFYLVDNGCKWRALPVDFPPRSTVFGYLTAWRQAGVWDRVHDGLRDRLRLRAGRRAEPTAAVIDSQSVRAAETVGRASRGWDAAKKVQGRKRHIAVDSQGLLLLVYVTGANVQDWQGAFFLLGRLRLLYRKISLVWADTGYEQHKLIQDARKVLRLTVQIVRRSGQAAGRFEPLPRRWVVERTLAWISQRRRCVRDYERLTANHEAMVTIAMIMLMSRRMAKPLPQTA